MEHAFEYYLGKRLKYEEIARILSLENPLYGFGLFLSGRQFIELDRENNIFKYKSGYSSGVKRFFSGAAMVLSYLIFFISGFAIFFYYGEVSNSENPYVVFPIGIVVILFVIFALSFLDDVKSLIDAKRFLCGVRKDLSCVSHGGEESIDAASELAAHERGAS